MSSNKINSENEKSGIGRRCENNNDCESEGEDLVCIENTCVPKDSEIAKKDNLIKKQKDIRDVINKKGSRINRFREPGEYEILSHVQEMTNRANNISQSERQAESDMQPAEIELLNREKENLITLHSQLNMIQEDINARKIESEDERKDIIQGQKEISSIDKELQNVEFKERINEERTKYKVDENIKIEEEDENTCLICLEPISSNHELIKENEERCSNCRVKFHSWCIDGICRGPRTPSCPNCRILWRNVNIRDSVTGERMRYVNFCDRRQEFIDGEIGRRIPRPPPIMPGTASVLELGREERVNFRIPVHDEYPEEYGVRLQRFDESSAFFSRYRRIDYENLTEHPPGASIVWNVNPETTIRQAIIESGINNVIDERGHIRNMNRNGITTTICGEFDMYFDLSANNFNNYGVFTQGQPIPVFVDGQSYAYHRDTLQLIGFINSRGRLVLRRDINPLINRNELVQSGRRTTNRFLPIPLPAARMNNQAEQTALERGVQEARRQHRERQEEAARRIREQGIPSTRLSPHVQEQVDRDREIEIMEEGRRIHIERQEDDRRRAIEEGRLPTERLSPVEEERGLQRAVQEARRQHRERQEEAARRIREQGRNRSNNQRGGKRRKTLKKKTKINKNNKKRTCKRIKVRINKDGSPNEEDMEHNRKCEQKYMYVDNPWMKPLLKKKKLTRYQKYLKKMLGNRSKTLKRKDKSTLEKYKTRNSPPFPANDYCNQKKKGNDGKMYISKPNKNNICSWKML